jgi:DEAD/DEAH box helicase domain-containing protein
MRLDSSTVSETAANRGALTAAYGALGGLHASFLENVELISANAGKTGRGFALCPSCGYAESEQESRAEGKRGLPPGFDTHPPLYRADRKVCSGMTGDGALLRNVTFSARQFTDLVRFEFTDVPGTDAVSLTTLGHALAQAGAVRYRSSAFPSTSLTVLGNSRSAARRI